MYKNLSILFENSKCENKNRAFAKGKEHESKSTHMKQKNMLKCIVTLMSQTNTELNAKLSFIGNLNK